MRRFRPLVAQRSANVGPKSFLPDPGLAETSEIGTFDQGTHLRHAPGCNRPEAGDAGITIVADQAARFGEFGGRALHVAFQGIGGGEERAELWVCRRSIA